MGRSSKLFLLSADDTMQVLASTAFMRMRPRGGQKALNLTGATPREKTGNARRLAALAASPWRDGTTHPVISQSKLMRRMSVDTAGRRTRQRLLHCDHSHHSDERSLPGRQRQFEIFSDAAVRRRTCRGRRATGANGHCRELPLA